MKLTAPFEVIESSKNLYDSLLILIEKEIQENKSTFDDYCLNILIENCPEKSLTSTNLSKIVDAYKIAGWDEVTTHPVEEHNRLRIKFFKY